MISPETEYLLTRAFDEAVLAIRSPNPAAAIAHHGLAVRYSSQAIINLAGGGGDLVARAAGRADAGR
jgi:hypothetical protein